MPKTKKKKESSIELPLDKTRKITDLSKASIFIYGWPKIGKSTLANQFKSFFIDTESGLKHLDVYSIKCDSWIKFKKIVRAIVEAEEDTLPYTTVVIDTVDILYKRCQIYTCERLGITHPADEDYGKGWEAIRDEFWGPITKLINSDFGIIFISHARENVFHKMGGDRTKITPTLPNTGRRVVLPLTDIILFIDYESYEVNPTDDEDENESDEPLVLAERRVVYTRPSSDFDAGDRTNLLPHKFEIDFETAKGRKKIREIFGIKTKKEKA